MSFLNSIKSAKFFTYPFHHWEIKDPLTNKMLTELSDAGVSSEPRAFDGTRAADEGGGGLDSNYRVFIKRNNYNNFPELSKLIEELRSSQCASFISALLKKDFKDVYVRIEVISDKPGFWLRPHTDIKEKLMSCLIFSSPNGESEDLGTDFYDERLKLVKTVKYRENYGYIFTQGKNTWHGLEKKKIINERRCLQVNYVTFETDWKVVL